MNSTLQKQLFGQLSAAAPQNINLVDSISDILGLSSDSAYRRLRGETALTIDELALLTKHFPISIDALLNKDRQHSVNFNFNAVKSKDQYYTYIKSIRDDMQMMADSRDARIIYAAEDIPLFHHFKSPELATFKIFYWLHSVTNDAEMRHERFSFDAIPAEILNHCRAIFDLYARIPSVEIWSEVTIESLIMQIDYFWESGIFTSKEDALRICDVIEEELKLIQLQAERTIKQQFNGAELLDENSYTLYLSDIEIGNNTILVEMLGQKCVYITHNTFNKMTTLNRSFCEDTEVWLKNITRKANLLSGVGETQRYKFFRKLFDRVNGVKAKISND